jgi:hypothetical protein
MARSRTILTTVIGAPLAVATIAACGAHSSGGSSAAGQQGNGTNRTSTPNAPGHSRPTDSHPKGIPSAAPDGTTTPPTSPTSDQPPVAQPDIPSPATVAGPSVTNVHATNACRGRLITVLAHVADPNGVQQAVVQWTFHASNGPAVWRDTVDLQPSTDPQTVAGTYSTLIDPTHDETGELDLIVSATNGVADSGPHETVVNVGNC